eukprot:11937949-Alexandrium_andersonii.AAC.1
MQIDELQVAVNQITTHCLGEDIGRVLLAGPFEQGEVPGAQALLCPQLAHCQAPDSPNAGTTAYTNGHAD